MTSQNLKKWMARLFWIFIWALAIYFIPFLLIMLDEVYLETRLITKIAPSWTGDLFNFLYAPLLNHAIVTKSNNFAGDLLP